MYRSALFFSKSHIVLFARLCLKHSLFLYMQLTFLIYDMCCNLLCIVITSNINTCLSVHVNRTPQSYIAKLLGFCFYFLKQCLSFYLQTYVSFYFKFQNLNYRLIIMNLNKCLHNSEVIGEFNRIL